MTTTFGATAARRIVGLVGRAWLTSSLAIWLSVVPAFAEAAAAPPIANQPVEAADYTAGQDSRPVVNQVSYTTGSAGHRLKWLPSRATQPGTPSSGDLQAQVAQYTAPVEAIPTPAPSSKQSDPFTDPFDDLKAGAGIGQAAKPLDDKILQGVTLKPVPAPSMPQLLARPAEGKPGEDAGEQGKKPESEDWALEMPKVEIEECPQPGKAYFKSIQDIKIDIRPKDKEKIPSECQLARDDFAPRSWAPLTFTWTASALCHKPLYFEEVQLERYGHTLGPIVEPFISAGHFFVTIPILPYKMGLYPPCECIYTLGYYRPGACAPYLLDPLPLSVRAGLFQAAAVTGAVYLIP